MKYAIFGSANEIFAIYRFIISHSFNRAIIFYGMNETRFRTFCANFVILATLLLTFGIAFVATYPEQIPTQTVNNAIYEGNQNSGSVSLMFNVYENTDNVKKIAEILDEYGYKTTFFVGGVWAAKNQDVLLQLGADGFEIGNHGYMHCDHAKLNLKQNEDEILVTQKLIDSALSSLPDYQNCKLFAPPSGSIGTKMFEACKKLDYKVIMWTRDTIDWRDKDADIIFERAIKDVKAGDLILMHPTDATVTALPRILSHLKSQNLKVDVVSKVIEK